MRQEQLGGGGQGNWDPIQPGALRFNLSEPRTDMGPQDWTRTRLNLYTCTIGVSPGGSHLLGQISDKSGQSPGAAGIEEGDARSLPSGEPDLIRKKPLLNGKTENSGICIPENFESMH